MTETRCSEETGADKTEYIRSSHVGEDNNSVERATEFSVGAFEVKTEMDDWTEIHEMEVKT